MRLRLVPQDTKFDFLRWGPLALAVSGALMAASVVLFFVMGLNFGIDFRGGTTIRTESAQPVDIGAYRSALAGLGVGDVSISEIFDPTFGPDQNVTMVRIQAQPGAEAVTPETIRAVEAALRTVDPGMTFPSVESVGPKVSGELIRTAILAVTLAVAAMLFYIWLRFEWQFSVGAVVALIHDITLTVGVFSLLQIKFDLAIIAALLTIVGYSINDTVIVFDRVRENLRKFRKMPLKDLLNLSVNETLSRTMMTSVTTLVALVALYVLGGDVIRGFVFAMIWGIVVGTYSSVFVASVIVLRLGVKRDWSGDAGGGPAGTQFARPDP
jgi:preprotein translocase subunit SecF